MAIVAAAGLSLFAALSQALSMLDRAERAREVDAGLRQALALVEHVDLDRTRRGELLTEPFTVRWSSRPLEAPRGNATGAILPGLYDVTLYEIDVELWRDGALAGSGVTRRASFVQARQPVAP